MTYDALSIDTQTIETKGYNFDKGLLRQLKQFSDGPIDIVISQVVAWELLSHLRSKTREAKDAVESAHRKAMIFGLKSENDIPFSPELDTDAIAITRLRSYLNSIGAEIIMFDDVLTRELMSMYTKRLPPFSDKKKNEFPDAIALLSLEKWAEKNDKQILAVSGDKDWAAYAAQSERIDVVSDLSSALEALQKDVESDTIIVRQLFEKNESTNYEIFGFQFEYLLSKEVRDTFFSAEGESAYAFESDSIGLELESYTYGDDEALGIRIVQSGSAIIAATVNITISVKAEAEFSFSIYDSVDRDYTPIGSTTAIRDGILCEITVLLTLIRSTEGKYAEIKSVEILDGLSVIEFGYVEPDHEEPDYDEFDLNAESEPNDLPEEIPF